MIYGFIAFYVISVMCVIQFWREGFPSLPITLKDIVFNAIILWPLGIPILILRRFFSLSFWNKEIIKAKRNYE